MKFAKGAVWLAIAATAGFSQVPVQKVTEATAKPLPRMANGKPDLSGMWIGGMGLLFGDKGPPAAPADGPQFGGSTLSMRMGPYKPELVAKVLELSKNDQADPEVHCFLLGTPRVTGWPFPFKIIQSPKETVILYEAMRTFRDIPTDGRDHRPDLDETYMGDSVGHWEGDTLVVDVKGFNDKTYISGRGTFHSTALHVVERYTPTPDGRIRYEAVAEDPQVLSTPWTVFSGILNHPVGSDMIDEYECIEGFSSDLEHIGPRN